MMDLLASGKVGPSPSLLWPGSQDPDLESKDQAKFCPFSFTSGFTLVWTDCEPGKLSGYWVSGVICHSAKLIGPFLSLSPFILRPIPDCLVLVSSQGLVARWRGTCWDVVGPLGDRTEQEG